jgi:hypothetical protein
VRALEVAQGVYAAFKRRTNEGDLRNFNHLLLKGLRIEGSFWFKAVRYWSVFFSLYRVRAAGKICAFLHEFIKRLCSSEQEAVAHHMGVIVGQRGPGIVFRHKKKATRNCSFIVYDHFF